MTDFEIDVPAVASRDEWRQARIDLLEREKQLTRKRDELNAERRRLPMVEIEKDYVFDGPDGEAGLLRSTSPGYHAVSSTHGRRLSS